MFDKKLKQVSVLTKDIEKTAKEYAALFGMPMPQISGGIATDCTYFGQKVDNVGRKMAFVRLDNIEIEMIEPYGGDSVWMDFIKETGGGIHHLGFDVDDIEASIKECEASGMKVVQRGIYASKTGEYAYLDAREQLNCFVELLCTYKK